MSVACAGLTGAAGQAGWIFQLPVGSPPQLPSVAQGPVAPKPLQPATVALTSATAKRQRERHARHTRPA